MTRRTCDERKVGVSCGGSGESEVHIGTTPKAVLLTQYSHRRRRVGTPFQRALRALSDSVVALNRHGLYYGLTCFESVQDLRYPRPTDAQETGQCRECLTYYY